MYVGWKAYLKQKFQPQKPHLQLGVALSHEAAFFTVLDKQNYVVVSEQSATIEHWPSALENWISEQKLSGITCCVSFTQHAYQLLQLDRPAVDDSEINAALGWTVKDMLGVDTPVAIDYFDVPVPLAGSQKLHVVALPQDEVTNVVTACVNAGVRLKQISIEELAHCELLPVSDEPVISLTQDVGEEIILNVIVRGNLYISRRLKGFENLGSFSDQELKMGVLDTLGIQLQRSMDFFESQLRQAPVRQVYINVNSNHEALIAMLISEMVEARVEVLELPFQTHKARYGNLTSMGMAYAQIHARQSVVEGAQ